jgi:hypothetical protein
MIDANLLEDEASDGFAFILSNQEDGLKNVALWPWM